jgi:predicted cupin superfamily sugar epimerase
MGPLNKKRSEFLIEKLGLQKHPEGGYYTETYRSFDKIEGINRNVQTCIYFLLTTNDVSRFHRIKSDEIWFHHEGGNLSIHTLDENGHRIHQLGQIGNNNYQPQILIKKNTIFGATLDEKDAYVLVSCTVAPGFDFEDFELMNRPQLLSDFPENEAIICQLT